jgi:hypothetical protein
VDQALVDQRRQPAQHVVRATGRPSADRLGRVQRAATREGAEPPEQRPLARREQVVAPRQRRPQAALAGRPVAGSIGQQQQPPVEPRQKRLRREQLGPMRRQLDRHRQPV